MHLQQATSECQWPRPQETIVALSRLHTIDDARDHIHHESISDQQLLQKELNDWQRHLIRVFVITVVSVRSINLSDLFPEKDQNLLNDLIVIDQNPSSDPIEIDLSPLSDLIEIDLLSDLIVIDLHLENDHRRQHDESFVNVHQRQVDADHLHPNNNRPSVDHRIVRGQLPPEDRKEDALVQLVVVVVDLSPGVNAQLAAVVITNVRPILVENPLHRVDLVAATHHHRPAQDHRNELTNANLCPGPLIAIQSLRLVVDLQHPNVSPRRVLDPPLHHNDETIKIHSLRNHLNHHQSCLSQDLSQVLLPNVENHTLPTTKNDPMLFLTDHQHPLYPQSSCAHQPATM